MKPVQSRPARGPQTRSPREPIRRHRRCPVGVNSSCRTALRTLLVATLVTVTASSAAFRTAALDDWPQWRGPRRDGVSAETGLLKTWPPSGPPLAWQIGGAGEGYSSFAVSAGRLYTLGARQGTEYVLAFDAATGKRLWEVANGRRFENDRGRRSAEHADGRRRPGVCVRVERRSDGARRGNRQGVLDAVNLLQQVRRLQHPVGPQRIAAGPERSHHRNAGGSGASIVALKKTDGSLIWKTQNDEPGYSSAVLHDARQPSGGHLLHRPARARCRRARRPAAVELRPRRQSHRQHRHADRAGQPRVPLVRLRHGRGAARARRRRQQGHGERGLLHQRDAQPPRELGAGRRLSLRLLERAS